MKRYLIAASAVLYVVQSDATTIIRPTFAGSPEVLVGTQALEVFKQCSRSAPAPSQVLPGPSKAEIEQLEQVVESYISVEYEANRLSPPDTTTYARQYVAYKIGGRRMIYGNYFPISFNHSKGQAVVVCDGGAQFWGVALDPKDGKVESIAFNGSA